MNAVLLNLNYILYIKVQVTGNFDEEEGLAISVVYTQ